MPRQAGIQLLNSIEGALSLKDQKFRAAGARADVDRRTNQPINQSTYYPITYAQASAHVNCVGSLVKMS